MPRKKPIVWPGVLGKPIGPKPMKLDENGGGLLGIWIEDKDGPDGRRWREAYIDRLEALCRRYDISGDVEPVDLWRVMLEAVVRECVPGFSQVFPEKRGPKDKLQNPEARTARAELLAMFEAAVDAEKKKGALSTLRSQTAILQNFSRHRSKLPSWFRSKLKGSSPKSLENAVKLAAKERATREAIALALTGPLGFGNWGLGAYDGFLTKSTKGLLD